MRAAIVGAGPTGLYLSIALARRGHQVVVVDRDQGPRRDGSWERRGVMQFHHPHAFRHQVVEALRAEMPEVLDAMFVAGAEAVAIPGAPEGVVAMRCRRLPFERVLRTAASREPGVELRTGLVESVVSEGGRAAGIRVDGRIIAADLVVDASGRAGRLGRDLRAPAEGGDSGIAYVAQQHELLPGADLGPTNTPIGMLEAFPGFLSLVFQHDSRTFSTLLVRATSDRRLAGLRIPAAFAAALRAVPSLAAWTDPRRSRPITPVMPGAHLYNSYRAQLDASGKVALPGLVFVGDAVCTTNPAFGRGVTTSLLQARHLLKVLGDHEADLESVAIELDDWCTLNIRPWFEDHVYSDADLLRRWGGEDIDLTRPLPSDLVVAAGLADPTLMPTLGPYLGMFAPPSSLDPVQGRACEIYASGWRPPVPAGPSRDELADLVESHALAGTVAG